MQGGLVLDSICSVKYGAFFTIPRPFLDRRKFFMIFFVLVFFQDEVEQLSRWKIFSGIGMVIEFHLQSIFIEILESF